MASTEANRRVVQDALYASLDELNEERSTDDQLAKAATTRLYGKGAALDSIDLVHLVVLLEQEIADHSEQSVTITDANAMSENHSAFQTVGTLVDYVVRLMEA